MRNLTRSLNALLAVLALLAIVIPAVTHDNAELWPREDLARFEGWNHPVNVPTFGQYADDWPSDCQHGTGRLADDVAVVTQGADPVVMSFDEAWNRSHDTERANDVWVVGTC